jgi:tetratricopeptide (TPR) repeat protein
MPETDSNVSLLDTISEDVNKRQEFDFFKTYLLRLDALRHHYDMELDQQIQLMEKALFIAKKHDEQVVVADLQSGLANVVKHFNMKRAIGYLDSSREISEQLGYRYNLGHIHQELGHIAGIRGEYDSAIDHFIEFQHVRESLKLPITMTKYLLATYCNLARNGEAALSAIEEAISSYESVRKISPYALIQRAWALTNLGQYGIAREELEASQEIAFKSGVVWYTSIWPKLVEGILEKVEGNYDEAKAIFEGVLDKFGHKPIPLVQNVCYLNLAEIEIELTKVDSLARPDGISGPWMEKLEEYVEENQLPGIRAQMLLLKASLYQRLGLFDETRELIQECRMLAESKGLDYLQRITNQLQLSLETKTRKDD